MAPHPCFQPASPQLPIPTPLHGVDRTRRDGSSFTWRLEPCQWPDSGEYSQKRYEKLVSRVDLHSSAVSWNGYRNRSQHRQLVLAEKKRSTEQRRALYKSDQPTKQRGKLQRTIKPPDYHTGQQDPGEADSESHVSEQVGADSKGKLTKNIICVCECVCVCVCVYVCVCVCVCV